MYFWDIQHWCGNIFIGEVITASYHYQLRRLFVKVFSNSHWLILMDARCDPAAFFPVKTWKSCQVVLLVKQTSRLYCVCSDDFCGAWRRSWPVRLVVTCNNLRLHPQALSIYCYHSNHRSHVSICLFPSQLSDTIYKSHMSAQLNNKIMKWLSPWCFSKTFSKIYNLKISASASLWHSIIQHYQRK